jgi:hypothetical protein
MSTGGAEAPALPLEALVALGLDQRTAENALINNKVTANLAAVIAGVSVSSLSALDVAWFRSVGFGIQFRRVLITTTLVTWCDIQNCTIMCYKKD